MIGKLGLMKIEKCSEEIKAIKRENDKKLEELRNYIINLENRNSNLKDENLRFKIYKAKNFKLENDITKLKRENEILKKAIKNRLDFFEFNNNLAYSMLI